MKGKKEREILASRFGDDWDAIPAYEQIYALAGPVQTYRITGDPLILDDAQPHPGDCSTASTTIRNWVAISATSTRSASTRVPRC